MVAPIIPMALVAGARFAPHIMRYLYPRVAPKAITGAQRFGQFMKANPKSAIATGGAMTLAPLMAPEEVHAPNNPYLQNMQQPYGPFMPYTAPKTEMPLGVDQQPSMPNALESTPQELKPHVNEQTQPLAPASPTPPPEPTDLDKFLQSNTYKFFQSDAYQKLKDLFAGMAAAPTDGSGWDALASGVKHLNEGDKQRGQVNQTVDYLKSKGYSEEEAAVMARNPQMLSALLTGDDTSKLPLGYQWYTNPQTGEREARPIKGSPQELEYNQKLQAQKEWEGKKQKNIIATKHQMNAGIDAIRDSIALIRKHKINGFKAWATRGIGGTPANELENLFDTIKGGALKAVFESLKSMDPRGSLSVGPISDYESRTMVATFGSLDSARNTKGLLKTLENLEITFNALNKLQKTDLHDWMTGKITPQEISDKYNTQKKGVMEFVKVSSPKESAKFEIGTKIQDADGNIRIKRY
ncbi:hypothetical protein Bgr_08440 [Bartonella grahamii as4aup]|uniref:Uncharacterized protein n=1 Tax=Bartonella grahamii (strain as4aup) TaxID=634504 RepID=C6AD69_BARGA|nr:hypothetical protein [Bartonella grahamii]ACS51130.1 hypothetical protein Bgr_08440 [Bartonella grahamii as4aup]